MDVSITEKADGEIIRVYDIEPNTRKSFSLPKRSRYYQAVTDVRLLDSGVDYDKLPELITIWSFWQKNDDISCEKYSGRNS